MRKFEIQASRCELPNGIRFNKLINSNVVIKDHIAPSHLAYDFHHHKGKSNNYSIRENSAQRQYLEREVRVQSLNSQLSLSSSKNSVKGKTQVLSYALQPRLKNNQNLQMFVKMNPQVMRQFAQENGEHHGNSRQDTQASNYIMDHSSNNLNSISPATTESGKSLGMRRGSQGRIRRRKLANNQSMRQQRFQPPQLPHDPHDRAQDTNNIYPPDKAYDDATRELQSPSKKRPVSGGPSPEKNQIKEEKLIEEPSFAEQQRKIFSDHKETQLLLIRAKASVQQSKRLITASIKESQDTINEYHRVIKEHQQQVEEKVEEHMKKHFIENKDYVPEVNKKTEKYMAKKDKKVEYKYAFGQRIPMEHAWKVQQIKEQDGKLKGPASASNIVYDLHGRPHKQKPVKKEPQEDQAMKQTLATQNEEIQEVEDQEEESPCKKEVQAEENGNKFVLPDWIKNPFACNYSSDSEGENNEEDQEQQAAEPIGEQKKPDQKASSVGRPAKRNYSRKQKDVVVRSKSRGAPVTNKKNYYSGGNGNKSGVMRSSSKDLARKNAPTRNGGMGSQSREVSQFIEEQQIQQQKVAAQEEKVYNQDLNTNMRYNNNISKQVVSQDPSMPVSKQVRQSYKLDQLLQEEETDQKDQKLLEPKFIEQERSNTCLQPESSTKKGSNMDKKEQRDGQFVAQRPLDLTSIMFKQEIASQDDIRGTKLRENGSAGPTSRAARCQNKAGMKNKIMHTKTNRVKSGTQMKGSHANLDKAIKTRQSIDGESFGQIFSEQKKTNPNGSMMFIEEYGQTSSVRPKSMGRRPVYNQSRK